MHEKLTLVPVSFYMMGASCGMSACSCSVRYQSVWKHAAAAAWSLMLHPESEDDGRKNENSPLVDSTLQKKDIYILYVFHFSRSKMYNNAHWLKHKKIHVQ